MITDLCDDVCMLLYECLDDRSCARLSMTCKRFHVYSLTYGFYKKFQFYCDDSYLMSLNILAKHDRTIKKLTIHSIEDPDLWIPHYATITCFDNCRLTTLNPPFIAKTEIIYVRDSSRKRGTKVKINKEKFPKLRRVLYV